VFSADDHDWALRRARLARNMTQEEVADALNAITGLAADASLISAWACVGSALGWLT
jgi:transcriptional regulator with XRE-family HTH domain